MGIKELGRPGSDRGSLSLAAALVVCAALAVLTLAGVFHGAYDSRPRNNRPPEQRDYIWELDAARHQLFDGRLVYTDATELRLVRDAPPQRFRADVLGGWRDRARTAVPGAQVRAGAQIGVKLHCSGSGVTCTPLSSERQPVLTKSDAATWTWNLSAKRTGTVTLSLTVTAYLRDTGTVLFERTPLDARTVVTAPPEEAGWYSWVGGGVTWLTDRITTAGGLASALTAILALIVTVRRRRTTGTEGAAEEGAARLDSAIADQAVRRPRGTPLRSGRVRTPRLRRERLRPGTARRGRQPQQPGVDE